MPRGFVFVDSIRIPQRIIDGDFPGWLRDAMNARHMSARMVGLQAGINPLSVKQLLYGGRQPTLITTIALLRLLGGGSDDESPW